MQFVQFEGVMLNTEIPTSPKRLTAISAAICTWGRSGSLLLASYLDGNEDVVMLPELCSYSLYNFWEHYGELSFREKLLAYPVFTQLLSPFFEGDFAISPAEYYAAVEAVVQSMNCRSRWVVPL